MWHSIVVFFLFTCSFSSAYVTSNVKNNHLNVDKVVIGLGRATLATYGNDQNQMSYALLQVRGGGPSSLKSLVRRDALMNPAIASLVAGSVAGACGVGVAFPLDTLKTKSQILGQAKTSSSSGSSSAALSDVSKMNMFQLFGLIYRMEGIEGFFGGVKGMMIGQAIIKSVAFSANQGAADFLRITFTSMPAVVVLVTAACFSGFVTSFLVAPIERVKVLMQATDTYKNEIDCLKSIIKNDRNGIVGVFSTGLGCTLAREVPSYGIYFLIYGLLIQSSYGVAMGNIAPLICGALTGMASWIPVYPIDVVKTLVQNSDGSENISALAVTKKLYEDNGVGAFFDGITPKMLRAAVNHSVTFYIYDILLNALK